MADPYSLGEVNVDSIKEIFSELAQVYPFPDETSKNAFTDKINSIDTAGNPAEVPNVEEVTTELDAANAKIAELQAQVDAANAASGQAQ